MKTNLKKLLLSVGAYYITAASVISVYGLGCLFSGKAEELKTPLLCPDGRFFCIVWLIICAVSGVALYRVFTTPTASESLKSALSSTAIMLFFYFLWAFTFFVLNEYCFAFAWFMCIVFFMLNTRRLFARINKTAGCLLIPQIAFTLFTGYLNIAVWILNI